MSSLAHEASERCRGVCSLRRTQRGRGLVDHDHPGVASKSPQDLDLLLICEPKRANESAGSEVEAGLRDEGIESPPETTFLDDSQPAGLDAEKDVLDHTPVRDERDLLLNSGNPIFERLMWGEVVALVAVDEQFPAVLLDDARDDLAERRLPGAVLADQRVNLLLRDRQIDPFEGLNASKALADCPKLDHASSE